jgi:hypothetical protein
MVSHKHTIAAQDRLEQRDELQTIMNPSSMSILPRRPRASTCELYKRQHGGEMPPMLQTVVPAAPDAWITALERFIVKQIVDTYLPDDKAKRLTLHIAEAFATKAHFGSLAEPRADTGTSTGQLMLAVLGGLADVERDVICTRTAEGRSRAKARGRHMGRPPKLTSQQQAEARRRRAEGATPAELARSYDVSRVAISRLRP